MPGEFEANLLPQPTKVASAGAAQLIRIDLFTPVSKA
jgi:hypothetical protein